MANGMKNFAQGLAGFGAGVTGQGQQFIANQQRQQIIDEEREHKRLEAQQKRAEKERLQQSKVAANLANRMDTLATGGNLEQAAKLGEQAISRGVVKDQGDLAKTIEGLRSQDPAARMAAVEDLGMTVDMARFGGFLPGEAKIGWTVSEDGTQLLPDQPGVAAQDIPDAKISDKELLDMERLYLQNKKARQELDQKAASPELSVKDNDAIQKNITAMTKDTRAIYSTAADLIEIGKTKSPTDQLAAVFKFMKALDPTSVVREGEQLQARRTGGPADQLIGFVNQIKGEGGLPESAFNNMISTAKRLANRSIEGSNSEIGKYLNTFTKLPDGFKTSTMNRIPKPFEIADDDDEFAGFSIVGGQ